jgi:hypothetical protein
MELGFLVHNRTIEPPARELGVLCRRRSFKHVDRERGAGDPFSLHENIELMAASSQRSVRNMAHPSCSFIQSQCAGNLRGARNQMRRADRSEEPLCSGNGGLIRLNFGLHAKNASFSSSGASRAS